MAAADAAQPRNGDALATEDLLLSLGNPTNITGKSRAVIEHLGEVLASMISDGLESGQPGLPTHSLVISRTSIGEFIEVIAEKLALTSDYRD